MRNISVSLFAVVISLTFCAKRPDAEIKAAEQALQEAYKQEANKYAPDEYKSAEEFLELAKKQYNQKEYDDAKVSAITSKRFSEIAIQKMKKIKEAVPRKEVKQEEYEEKIEEEVEKPQVASLIPITGVRMEDVIGKGTGGKGYILKFFKKIYFDFDSYQLRVDAQESIKANVEYLKKVFQENPNAKLLLEGHCDERGTEEYNIELGFKRALSVKTYITDLGLPADRIETTSWGEEFPEEPCQPGICADESKWQKNRRTVFVIIP